MTRIEISDTEARAYDNDLMQNEFPFNNPQLYNYTEADLDYWVGIAKRNYFTYGFFAGVVSASFIATLIILLR